MFRYSDYRVNKNTLPLSQYAMAYQLPHESSSKVLVPHLSTTQMSQLCEKQLLNTRDPKEPKKMFYEKTIEGGPK